MYDQFITIIGDITRLTASRKSVKLFSNIPKNLLNWFHLQTTRKSCWQPKGGYRPLRNKILLKVTNAQTLLMSQLRSNFLADSLMWAGTGPHCALHWCEVHFSAQSKKKCSRQKLCSQKCWETLEERVEIISKYLC